jgi:hypothetical protein
LGYKLANDRHDTRAIQAYLGYRNIQNTARYTALAPQRFSGAILFLLVDKYEPEGPLARLLKFLILFVAGVAILHKLQPYSLALF